MAGSLYVCPRCFREGFDPRHDCPAAADTLQALLAEAEALDREAPLRLRGSVTP